MLSPQDSASPWSKGRGWANAVTNAEAVTLHAACPLMTGTASSQFLPERIKNKETDPECPHVCATFSLGQTPGEAAAGGSSSSAGQLCSDDGSRAGSQDQHVVHC